MTILAALQALQAQTTGINQLIYADLNEANEKFVDQLTSAQLPVMIVLQYNVKDSVGNGAMVKSKFPFEAFILTKYDQATVDVTSIELETTVIAPMRLLARRFMHNFARHEIRDKSEQLPDVTYNPVYSTMDANLHGVHILPVELPVLEHPAVC